VICGAGWHDVHVRWDVSTPETVVSRLADLPRQGAWPGPGRTLWAERGRFGKWEHLLGDRTTLVGWVTDHPTAGLVRRLEVQTHLGPEGEDDLCAVEAFPSRWAALQQRMALYGVLPASEPRVTRLDYAIDIRYADASVAQMTLEALRFARWPNGWYAEWAGAPPYTTVNVKAQSKTIGRVYCRNTKLRNGRERLGKLRFEREQLFPWAQAWPAERLGESVAGAMIWGSVFGENRAAGSVKRIAREVQTVKLVDRVRLGELTYAQFERMTAFLDAERLGLTDQVYTPEQARSRRREAKQLGLSESDTEYPEFDVVLDELLDAPRSAFAA